MRTLIFNGLVLLLASSTLAHAQTRELSGSGELLDRVAAVVNDGVILKSEVDMQTRQFMDQARARGGQVPPEAVLRKQVLEHLINQEVKLQFAARVGFVMPDEAVNNKLREIATSNRIEFDQLPAKLKEQGINYADFRDSIRKQMTTDYMTQREISNRVRPTPREVDQYLARQSSSLQNEDFDVSFILLTVPEAATPEQATAVEKRAQEIRARAVAGEDFAQLAVSYSNAQNALEGGALGWRKGPDLPSVIAGVVKDMKPGDVTELMRTPSGYQFFKLNDRRGAEEQVMANQVHARHILIVPNELQDDDIVKQKLTAIRERILKGEDFAAIAQSTSEDPGSSAQGGDLGWADESGAYDPAFARALAMLAEKEISEPFRTRYGWHIVQLLGRRVEDVTTEKRREQAMRALLESRADEEEELWVRRLRDEAFIEYKM